MRPDVSTHSFAAFISRLSSLVALLALLSLVPLSALAQEERATEKAQVEKARQEAAAKQQASPDAAKQDETKKPEDEKAEDDKRPADPMSSGTFNGLKLRSIGPAFTSGRVIGFAVDPNNPSRYFVAAASGGVWKTINGGTTWTPVFDREGSYSIGCIALDPKNPLTVWVGTGEQQPAQRLVRQRHLPFGRRRQDLEKPRAENFRTHWPHRHRSQGFKYCLRRGSGTALGRGRRSWIIQNN
jgi:type II secretory pathway pseudopilin PulG